ncbi:MAG: hypothetical protein AMR96_07010 [Candidatus Adiutrix intracellularis]|jgi:cell division septal protein FtsQ|nr:MAG: hypothetical protein AMR96_07010 [Candidatus Adiutrix intracellularis]MDR2827721.1 FtsQ-type POTRA domain-containing protein [Candidatus Adiutrix intracellularis]
MKWLDSDAWALKKSRLSKGVRYARGAAFKVSGSRNNSQLQAGRLAALILSILGRSLKVIIATGVALLFLALLTVFLIAGYLYVSKSNYFSVKKVIISGINQINRKEILAAAGLDRPVNSWLFDVEKASATLSLLPWLDKVKVTKTITMPDTVSVDVVEHRPRFLVSLGRLYYLDDKGEPFKELSPGEKPDLPIVSGFSEDEILSCSPIIRESLNQVFLLADILVVRNDEFRLDNISEINYDAVRGLTLFTKNNDFEVKIGLGAFEEKFRRLGRVIAHLKLYGQFDGLVYVNLEASPRVIVRYNCAG